MKIPLQPLFAGLVLAIGLCLPCLAQTGGNSQGLKFGSDPALKAVFRKFQSFSGEVQVNIVQEKTSLSMLVQLQVRSGNSRTEMDMRTFKGAELDQESVDQMLSLGFNPMVTLTLEDGALIYVLYPSLKAYASQKSTQKAGSPQGEVKVVEKDLGEESVESHPCVKRQVMVTVPGSKPKELVVWAAKDMGEFPVKVEYSEKGEPYSLSFRKVVFAEPAASQFELPKDYTAYASVRDLMQGEMSKAMDKME
jgi:hypothetical protein